METEKSFFSATTGPNLMSFVAFKNLKKSSDRMKRNFDLDRQMFIKSVENCKFSENETMRFTTV